MASAQQTVHQLDLCPESFHKFLAGEGNDQPSRNPKSPVTHPVHPSTWVLWLGQLLLLSCVAVALREVRGMGCWVRKVGEGWIKGGVCPKAEPRPLCWLRICW